MAKQIKVYVLRSGTRSQYGKKINSVDGVVEFEFKGGSRSGTFIPGRLVTSDEKVIEAVETHPKYGAEFYLHEGKTKQANEGPKVQPRNVTQVANEPAVEHNFGEKVMGVGAKKAKDEADIIAQGMASLSEDELAEINKKSEEPEKVSSEADSSTAEVSSEADEKPEEPKEEGPEVISSDKASTVPQAGKILREKFADVKASEVNTKAGIKAVADSKGVVFEGIDFEG